MTLALMLIWVFSGWVITGWLLLSDAQDATDWVVGLLVTVVDGAVAGPLALTALAFRE